MKDSTLLFPVIMLIIVLIMSGAVFFLMKKPDLFKPKNKNGLNLTEKTANDLINVKNIEGSYLYTKDNCIQMYLKIKPVSLELYSSAEQLSLINRITAALSMEKQPFRIICTFRPFDISALINTYSSMRQETSDTVQRGLLKNDMEFLANNIMQGKILERQFYLVIWQDCSQHAERELAKRAGDLIFRLGNDLALNIAQKSEIITVCNQLTNPNYAFSDNIDAYEDIITLLKT